MARDTSKRGSGRKATTVALDARPVFGLDLADAKAPNEFRILKAGLNPSEKGTFLFDDESARRVMEKYAERGVPMCMDYEHQSLVSPPVEAPASAKQITPQVRNGELWATDVVWTDRGRAYVESGEYRLFSPAFRFEETENGELRVTELINVALTNNPALHGIEPLMAASAQENTMTDEELTALKAELSALKKECAALKAEKEELSAKLVALSKKKEDGDDDGDEEMKATRALRREVVALTGQTTAPAAAGVISAWKKSHEDIAPLRARVVELEQKDLDREFESVCALGAREGKITPGEIKDENGLPHLLAKESGKVTATGLAKLKAHVGAAQPRVTVDGKETPQKKSGTAVLSTQEIFIAKQLGIDPKTHEAFLTEREAARTGAGQ